MKTLNVVAAILFDRGRVFATQRGYGDFKDGWEFPGGKIEPGERPQEALVREIREELGVEIEVGRLLHTVDCDYPDFHLHMQCYVCTILFGQLQLREHEAARWLGPSELWSVDWLPADVEVVREIEEMEKNKTMTIVIPQWQGGGQDLCTWRIWRK
ncbi:MAG: (deoxy)nucleoside triphosphate pyrophosphohydrolase [Firmicutes bacterium]|nr:(deoxy)nucleoside triphosphate pyrophosphohydrolase [Bacillota bacterium]